MPSTVNTLYMAPKESLSSLSVPFLIPGNFDYRAMPDNLQDGGIYILHAIIAQVLRHRATDMIDAKVHLNAEILQRFIGCRYRKALDWLINAGVIDVDNRYSAGKHSRSYSINPPYDSSTRYVTMKDGPVSRRVAEYRQARVVEKEERKRSRPMNWVEDKLAECVRQATISNVDYDWLKSLCVYKKGTHQQFSAAHQLQIDAVNIGEYFNETCDYGRFHSNFTCLWSPVRKFITVDGSPLRGFDIVSSQPVFLGLTIAREWGVDLCLRDNGDLLSIESISLSSIPPIPCLSSHTLYANRVPETRAEELLRYIRLVESGQLYEELQRASDNLDMSRNAFKYDVFFPYLFGRNIYRGKLSPAMQAQQRLYNAFRLMFPNMAHTIAAIKKKRGYASVAHDMQRAESSFVIRTVCARLFKERPDIYLLTIHDSILTSPDTYQYVRRVTENEFAKLGVYPQLKEVNYVD